MTCGASYHGCADYSRAGVLIRGVMAGLVPAIPIEDAPSCPTKRDARHKAGHDGVARRSAAKTGSQLARQNDSRIALRSIRATLAIAWPLSPLRLRFLPRQSVIRR